MTSYELWYSTGKFLTTLKRRSLANNKKSFSPTPYTTQHRAQNLVGTEPLVIYPVLYSAPSFSTRSVKNRCFLLSSMRNPTVATKRLPIFITSSSAFRQPERLFHKHSFLFFCCFFYPTHFIDSFRRFVVSLQDVRLF